MIEFDVLIASYNRAETFKKCLDSFPDSVPSGLGKVLFIILDSDSESMDILSSFGELYPIEIIKTDRVLNPGASRNRLIDQSTKDYLAFLDDDILIPDNYFSTAIDLINKNKMEIFGGPDKSPQDDSLKQKIIGDLLAHPYVMGPTYERHSCEGEGLRAVDETKLTLCNMWIKRSALVSNHLKFSENLRRCEENQLLEELKSLGHSMYYVPNLFVYHFRRESLLKMAKVQFLSGYYRSVCFYINQNAFKSFFLIPIITGALLFVYFFLPTWFQLILLILHTFLAWSVCYNILKKYNSVQSFFWGWGVLIVIHLFFSLGMFLGILLGWKNAKSH